MSYCSVSHSGESRARFSINGNRVGREREREREREKGGNEERPRNRIPPLHLPIPGAAEHVMPDLDPQSPAASSSEEVSPGFAARRSVPNTYPRTIRTVSGMKMKFTRSAVLASPPTGQQGKEGMQRGTYFVRKN